MRVGIIGTKPCPTCDGGGECEPHVSHEFLLAHPNHPFWRRDEEVTKMPCPRCEHCGACNGTQRVTAAKRADMMKVMGTEIDR